MKYLIPILLMLVACGSNTQDNQNQLITCEEQYNKVYKFGEFINNLQYIGVSREEVNLHVMTVPLYVDKDQVINIVYSAPPRTYQVGEVGNLLVRQVQDQHVCQ